MRIVCSLDVVDQTLVVLKEAGERRLECVVLWLGRRETESITVVEMFRPIQMARADMFRIPPDGMHDLNKRLRDTRSMVAAQIHTHPREAFHSQADDRWAIVRHEGALSLVLPNFAQQTDRACFMADVKVFRLSSANEWTEVLEREEVLWLQAR